MAPQINVSEWQLKRLATVNHSQDVPAQTIREMASELLSLRQQIAQMHAKAVEPAHDEVPIPQNADQAQLMALVSENWLKHNAPERLKDCPHCGKPRAAHPAPLDSDTRKPLTDEQMRECAQAMTAEPLTEGWPELIKFARAIEKSHGIGAGE